MSKLFDIAVWGRKPDSWDDIPSIPVPLLSDASQLALAKLRGFSVPDFAAPLDIEWPEGSLSNDFCLLRRGVDTFLVRREGYNYVRYAVRLTGFSLSVAWEPAPLAMHDCGEVPGCTLGAAFAASLNRPAHRTNCILHGLDCGCLAASGCGYPEPCRQRHAAPSHVVQPANEITNGGDDNAAS